MSTAAWPFYMELAINSVEEGNLSEAEELCDSAVREAESSDPEGRRLAASLQALATLCCHRGRYLRARRLYYRAWSILKSRDGETAPATAAALVEVGWTCLLQNQPEEAEPLFTEALAALENNRSAPRAVLVRCLHGLGDIHLAAGRRVAAVVAYQHALAIEEADRAGTLSLIAALHRLGDLYVREGRYQEAGTYYWRAQKIAAAACGADSPAVARTLQRLAEMYRLERQLAQAESLLGRAQPMLESALGGEHAEMARHFKALSLVYTDQARYAEAEALLARAVTILEKSLSPGHPEVADLLELRAGALETCHQSEAAPEVREHAARLRETLAAEERSFAEPAVTPNAACF